MNTIQIPLTNWRQNDEILQLVEARLLHQTMEVGRDFTTWLKNRIAEFGFEKEIDYIQLDSPDLGNQNSHGGDRRSVNIYLTLDMAKELAMVERNEQGKAIRRYFIECERKLKQTIQQTHLIKEITLNRAERQQINREAWADVQTQTQQLFNRRRDELTKRYLEQKRQQLIQPDINQLTGGTV